MKIRRFFAPDMRRAIQLVRAEHGADAVILSSRAVDGGMEIISAVDYDEELVAQMIQPRARSREDATVDTAAGDAAGPAAQAGASAASANGGDDRSSAAVNAGLSAQAVLAARAEAALAAVERLAGAATGSAAAAGE